LVQKHTGKDAKIKVMPDQPGDVPYTCADVTKASRMLGYNSKVSFDEGIRLTAEWYAETYNAKDMDRLLEPETQAGLGRAPSFSQLPTFATST
jgi:UDP-glucuronate 4-epimerase